MWSVLFMLLFIFFSGKLNNLNLIWLLIAWNKSWICAATWSIGDIQISPLPRTMSLLWLRLCWDHFCHQTSNRQTPRVGVTTWVLGGVLVPCCHHHHDYLSVQCFQSQPACHLDPSCCQEWCQDHGPAAAGGCVAACGPWDLKSP